MLKHCLMIAGAISAAAAIQGCAQKPSITKGDLSDVLSMAVFAAAKKLPPSFCLDPKLHPSSVIWRDQPGSEGWAVSTINPGLKFRRVLSPKLGKIPNSALPAFPKTGAGKDCHHTLEFEEPDLAEIESSSGTYLDATVIFYDPCPICGAGYLVEFTKKPGKSWVMVSRGVTITAVS